MAVRIDILRPMDTDRMGWTQSIVCEGTCSLKPWRPPADMRRLNWAYVVQATRCSECRKPIFAIFFKGVPPLGYPCGKSMGEVRREPLA